MYLNDAMLDSGALARRLLAPANNLVPVNLLTRQDASLEDAGVGTWAASNAAVARSTAQAVAGSASLSITSSAAGSVLGYTSGTVYPVSPGKVYSGVASLRSAAITANASIQIAWYTPSGSFVSASSSSSVALSASAWQSYRMTAVAPATAAFASVRISWTAVGASEVVYVDAAGLWEGAGGSWVNGGERLDPSTLGWYWDESVGRRLFVWDTINSRWQMVYGDTGWRDVTASCTAVTGGTVLVRRLNGIVSVRLVSAVLTAGTGVLSFGYTFPAGLQSDSSSMCFVGMRSNSASYQQSFAFLGSVLYWSGETNLTSGSASQTRPAVSVDAQGTWQTSAAWPTSLPGTASGTIPAT